MVGSGSPSGVDHGAGAAKDFSCAQRLTAQARTAWPQLAAVHVRHCGQFAHVDGELAAGESIKLMRLH